MAIKSKFLIGAACILLVFCGGVAMVAYIYLKDAATKDIYKDTEIFIATADATRTYVKDVLRPTVSNLIPKLRMSFSISRLLILPARKKPCS